MYRGLVICNSTYPEDPGSFGELMGPRSDGLFLWNALVDDGAGLFHPTDVKVLFERTSHEILMAAERFFQDADDGDTLLFYFSGHGKRAAGELYLCARNTLAGSLRSTAISADVLTKIMGESLAGATIVILDCCHAGAFKSAEFDDFGSELAGRGRFVLAACMGVDLAPDSKSTEQASPFTAALIEGILGEAIDGNGDGRIDLDELERYVRKRLKKSGPSPVRNFHGSGSPFIANLKTGAELPPISTAAWPVDDGESAKSVARPQVAGLEYGALGILPERLLHRIRRRSDYSIGDVRLWIPLAISGVLSCLLSVWAFVHWDAAAVYDVAGNRVNEKADPYRYAALVLAGAATLILTASAIEGWLLRGALHAESTRSVIGRLEGKAVRRVRIVRDAAASVSFGVLISTLFGVENYDDSWVAALSMLTAVIVAAVISNLRYGDAAYLAGTFLIIFSAFLPARGSDMQISLNTGVGTLTLIIAAATLLAWWLRVNTGPLFLLSLACALGLFSSLYSGYGISFWVAATGVCLSMVAALLGCGLSLDRWEDERRGAVGVPAMRSKP
jgi:hypothetical protein